MTSLMHQRRHGSRFRDSDSEALSYLKDTGWTSRMATPSPAAHLTGAALFVGLGTWAAIAVGRHSLATGIALGAAAALLAVFDVLPAVWTLSHREYTGRYLAARMRYGNGSARLHPLLVLVGMPAVAGVAAAFTSAHGSATARLVWGLLGAAAGSALGLLRVAHARRSVHVPG
ncbi:MAG: hypothetical protein QOE76_2635 [Frankiales bacterium]|nr:hypothetical protein [Frankiales bacterium]MDX6244912.1 hypothetical protein [Frankiales bacterium]